MQIPGKGRLNKSINLYKARRIRQFFIKKFAGEQLEIIQKKSIPIKLVSFSSDGTYHDQSLSILSFLKFVGIPEKWTIFSDGTYLKKQIESFERFSFIEFVENWSEQCEPSLGRHLITWQEKKYFAFASVNVDTTHIFLDSDVLFFPGFNQNVLNAIKLRNWYLPYFEPQFDLYFLKNETEYYHKMNYTNSGFFILNENIDWEPGKKYLNKLNDNNIELSHFSEQTAMEIVFKQNRLQFLDQKLFCLSLDDHFTLGSRIKYSDIAIRHFVGPIRFRMWQAAKQFDFFL